MKKLTNILTLLLLALTVRGQITRPPIVTSELQVKDTITVDDVLIWQDHQVLKDSLIYFRQIANGFEYKRLGSQVWEEVVPEGFVPDSIWSNYNGAFRLFGGQITANIDGTVDVAAGGGMIKTEEAGPEDIPTALNQGQGGLLHYVEWPAFSSVALTPNAYNYIYFDGTDSTMKATTNFYSLSFTQDFTVGRAYRENGDIVVRLCGTNAWNFNRRLQLFGEEVFPVVRGTGLKIGELANRKFSITAGVLWAEIVNRFSIAAFDGNTTSFTYWYRDGVGGWAGANATAIDAVNYDNGTGILEPLTPQHFSVHWVYVVHDGSVHVVYGQGNYLISEAEIAMLPADLPGLLDAYATLVGKITILKNDTEFTDIVSAFEEVFARSQVGDHNDQSNIQGGIAGQYYHNTADEYSYLQNWYDSTAALLTGIRDTTLELYNRGIGDLLSVKANSVNSVSIADDSLEVLGPLIYDPTKEFYWTTSPSASAGITFENNSTDTYWHKFVGPTYGFKAGMFFNLYQVRNAADDPILSVNGAGGATVKGVLESDSLLISKDVEYTGEDGAVGEFLMITNTDFNAKTSFVNPVDYRYVKTSNAASDGQIIRQFGALTSWTTPGSMIDIDFWSGTQAAYDALGTYDSNTIYFIED